MKTFIIVLVLAIICLQTSWGQRTPTISLISQEQVKDIGGTVELECSVQYSRDYPVLWIKRDPGNQQSPLLISSGSSLIIRDSRFSLRFDPSSSLYTLQVKDLQETDAGTYQCQILIGVNNRVTADVDVMVRMPPVISDNSTRSLVVSEKQPVTLECYASGFPPPKISWRRENNAILPTGGSIYRGNTLKILSVKKEDRGTYYCVAENSVGKGARRNIALEVEFAPVISVTKPKVGQALQYDADLECHVEAYPPPTIFWEKDDVQLANNQHYRISNFNTADAFTDSTLRVITIEKKQYGMYKCKAANKLGESRADVELFENVIPVCPPACGHTYYGGVASVSSALSMLLVTFLAFMLWVNMEEQKLPKDFKILRRLARLRCTQKQLQRDIRRVRESTDIPRKEREELLQRLRNVDADLAANRNTLTRLMEENNELRQLKQKYVALKSSLSQGKADDSTTDEDDGQCGS